jgi:hypothetical protein
MIKVKAFWVFCTPPWQLSAAFTVKVKVPVADGVPLSKPVELTFKPEGKTPETMLKVIGACPPDVVI